jgi:hypothetical protein
LLTDKNVTRSRTFAAVKARRRGTGAILLPVLFIGLLGDAGSAQRGFFREGSLPARPAPSRMPDAAFVICRMRYTQVRREPSGIGWQTDYPYAEVNLTTRFSELTKARVSRDDEGTPNYYAVRLTDDALFNCPIIVASESGTFVFYEGLI